MHSQRPTQKAEQHEAATRDHQPGVLPHLLRRRWQRWAALIVVNAAIVAALLYGFEFTLRLTDPARKLPFRGINADGEYVSWGHVIVVNQYGFREREFAVPRPSGVCRIMVLGDSFTWGTGLAVEERYTNLVESYLNDRFPQQTFEVLNFAMEGLPTVTERDILRQYKDRVEPDLIVVGFYLDDPQPRGYTYRVEREQFYQKYRIQSIVQTLKSIGLTHTGAQVEKAIDGFIVDSGIAPTIEEGLQRTYEADSQEWMDFVQALQDIKAMSDEMGLPPPVFVVLNDTRGLTYATSYDTPDEEVDIYRRWFHQGERAAIEAGFRTHNHEPELAVQPYTSINELDGHASASVNLIYAQKLFDVLEQDVISGDLCGDAPP